MVTYLRTNTSSDRNPTTSQVDCLGLTLSETKRKPITKTKILLVVYYIVKRKAIRITAIVN